MFALRLLLLGCWVATSLPLQQAVPDSSRPKVFVQTIDGFGTDLTAALIGANVPVVIVTDQKEADLIIGGRRQHRSRGTYTSDSIEEATLTVTDRHSGTVIEAFTVSADSVEKLAKACAARLSERIAGPPAPAPSLPAPRAAPRPPAPDSSPSAGPSPPASAIRLFVQGEINLLADFTEVLRAELRANGMTVRIVQRGDEYDYNIIFVQHDTHASAVALDRQGVLVTSTIDSGFRAKGVAEGAAKQLAKRLSSLKRE